MDRFLSWFGLALRRDVVHAKEVRNAMVEKVRELEAERDKAVKQLSIVESRLAAAVASVDPVMVAHKRLVALKEMEVAS